MVTLTEAEGSSHTSVIAPSKPRCAQAVAALWFLCAYRQYASRLRCLRTTGHGLGLPDTSAALQHLRVPQQQLTAAPRLCTPRLAAAALAVASQIEQGRC